MNLKNIFKRKKKGYAGVEDLVSEHPVMPDLGRVSMRKTICTCSDNETIKYYPMGLSDEEKDALRKECEAKGYEFVEINIAKKQENNDYCINYINKPCKIFFSPNGTPFDELQERDNFYNNGDNGEVKVIRCPKLTLDMFNWEYAPTLSEISNILRFSGDPFHGILISTSKSTNHTNEILSTIEGSNIVIIVETPYDDCEGVSTKGKLFVRFIVEPYHLSKSYLFLTKEEVPEKEEELRLLLERRLNEKIEMFYYDIKENNFKTFAEDTSKKVWRNKDVLIPVRASEKLRKQASDEGCTIFTEIDCRNFKTSCFEWNHATSSNTIYPTRDCLLECMRKVDEDKTGPGLTILARESISLFNFSAAIYYFSKGTFERKKAEISVDYHVYNTDGRWSQSYTLMTKNELQSIDDDETLCQVLDKRLGESLYDFFRYINTINEGGY